jgi:hypothetical protein
MDPESLSLSGNSLSAKVHERSLFLFCVGIVAGDRSFFGRPEKVAQTSQMDYLSSLRSISGESSRRCVVLKLDHDPNALGAAGTGKASSVNAQFPSVDCFFALIFVHVRHSHVHQLSEATTLAAEGYPYFELARKVGKVADPAGRVHFQLKDDQSAVVGDAVDLGVVG